MSPAAKLALPEFESLESVVLQIPVFRDFPKSLLDPLFSVSECLDIAKDKTILSQGQINADLYFLVEGKASIFVDGGLVGQVQGNGVLLGEMSVIKRQPVTATIVADTDVRLICVKTNLLLQTDESLKTLYQSVLYCLYSHVLVEKLEATNKKAKQFEETNAKLKSAEKDLNALNENLEQRVQEKSQAIESRLGELNDSILVPLMNHPKMDPEIHAKVVEAIDQIAPIRASLNVALKLKDQKILCLDGVKKNQMSIKLALGGTGAILSQIQDQAEFKTAIHDHQFALIIMDKNFLGELAHIRVTHPTTPVLLLLDGPIQDQLQDFSGLEQCVHLLIRSSDKKTNIQNTLSAVTKIFSNQLFGIEPYTGFGVEAKSSRITTSAGRSTLIDEMDAYLAASGVRPSYRDRIKLVAEELLMNAIYDAPCDPISRAPLFNHLPRTELVQLAPPQQGWLSYCFDGTKVCLSVRDPFGALKPDVIFKYLKNSYSPDPQDINSSQGKGGAGRGLHQIVESSDELIFNLAPGKKTEVISVIYTETDRAEGDGTLIHLFVDPA